MIGFKSFEVSTVQRPGFTAKEKNRHTHGIIDGDFGRDGQVVIVEYTMREPAKGGRCQLDTLIDLIRNITIS